MDALGWVYFKRGEGSKALPLLKSTVEKAPENPVHQYHLGMAYYLNDDSETARMHLQKAAESGLDFKGKQEAKSTLAKLPATQ